MKPRMSMITLGVDDMTRAVDFYQNGLGMTLFADRSTVAYKFLRPETYLIFGALFILILTPPLLALFGWLRKHDREPSTPLFQPALQKKGERSHLWSID